MRIIVCSDSHQNRAVLENIVLAHPDADIFLHLGDGEREFEELAARYPEKKMLGVAGNCDWGSGGKVIDFLTVGGNKIMFAHGHTFAVKRSLDKYLRAAREFGATVALFGHTHVAYKSYRDGLHIMNPGSVSSPNSGPPSYGIVDVTPAGIVLNIVKLDRGAWRR